MGREGGESEEGAKGMVAGGGEGQPGRGWRTVCASAGGREREDGRREKEERATGKDYAYRYA